MAGLSVYWADSILNHTFRGVALPTLPANLYAALHTADPTDAGTGAEAAYTGYARVALSRGTGTFAAPSAFDTNTRTTSNSGTVTFGAPTSGPTVVTHVAIWDATTAGNLIASGALTASRTLNSGDAAPSFAVGDLDINLA